jgi:two-component system cell cycle response regulator DivK
MSRPGAVSSTILVVSHDAQIRETTTELLELGSHRVLTAATGEQGLGMALTVLPDLILVDYDLPGMNSLEMVERLKAGVAPRKIPVAVLTSGPAEAANGLTQAGCIASISKPIERFDLLRLIDRILSMAPGNYRP